MSHAECYNSACEVCDPPVSIADAEVPSNSSAAFSTTPAFTEPAAQVLTSFSDAVLGKDEA